MTELKVARIRAGLTAREAARRLGVAPHTLSRLENGHTRIVDAGLIARMARLYGCPVELLMEALYPAECGEAVAHG